MPSDFDGLHGHQMPDREIDRLLREVGVGVLSMSNDEIPYGLPLSFGYDGDRRLYFGFVGHSQDGRKVNYAESSTIASFLVFDIESKYAWRSAIIAGSLDRIGPDAWESAREAMAANAFRPQLLTDVNIQEDPRVWVLTAEEKSGRAIDAE